MSLLLFVLSLLLTMDKAILASTTSPPSLPLFFTEGGPYNIFYYCMDLGDTNGETFLIGGALQNQELFYPFVQYMSLQGTQIWNRQVSDSSLQSVGSIQFVNGTSPYFIVVFSSNAFTLGKFSIIDWSIQLIYCDPNAYANSGYLQLNSIALSGSILYVASQSDSSAYLKLLAINLNTFSYNEFSSAIDTGAQQSIQTDGDFVSVLNGYSNNVMQILMTFNGVDLTSMKAYRISMDQYFVPGMHSIIETSNAEGTQINFISVSPSVQGFLYSGTGASCVVAISSQFTFQTPPIAIQSTQQKTFCLQDPNDFMTVVSVKAISADEAIAFLYTKNYYNIIAYLNVNNGSFIFNYFDSFFITGLHITYGYVISFVSFSDAKMYFIGSSSQFQNQAFSYSQGFIMSGSQQETCFSPSVLGGFLDSSNSATLISTPFSYASQQKTFSASTVSQEELSGFLSTYCSQNCLSTATIGNQNYSIGASPFSSPTLNSNSACGGLTYDLLVNGTEYGSSTLYSLGALTFNSSLGNYTIKTSNLSLYGDFNFTIVAQYGSASTPQSFQQLIVNPCINDTITAATQSSISYEVLGTNTSYPLSAFVYTSYSICGPLIYDLTYSNESSLDASIFNFDQSNMLLYVSTNDYSLCNLSSVDLIISGMLPWNLHNKTTTFSVSFKCSCWSGLSTTIDIYSLTYELGLATASSTFQPFAFAQTFCSKSITYSLSQAGSNTLADSYYYFNTSTLTFYVNSSTDASLVGNYEFILTASASAQGEEFSSNSTLQLMIVRSCLVPQIVKGNPIPNPINYTIGNPQLNMTFDQWNVTDPGNCGSFNYSLFVVNYTFAEYFINFTNSTMLMTVYTSNISQQGNYTLQLQGCLSNSVCFSEYFILEIQNQCIPTYLQPPQQSTFYTYIIASPVMPIPILPFTPNINCNDTILYESTQVSGNSASFISFDSVSKAFQVQTSNYNDAGTYKFQVTAYILQNQVIVVQNQIFITVQASAPSTSSFTAPYFTKALSSVKLYYSSQQTLDLPPIKDDQGDKVIITLPNKPSFVTISGTTLSLSPAQKDIGSYSMQIILADANDTMAKNSYSMTIQITNSQADSSQVQAFIAKYLNLTGDLSSNSPHSFKPLSAQIANVDQFGDLSIDFDTKMFVFPEIAILEEANAFEIKLLMNNGTVLGIPAANQSANQTNPPGWKITQFTDTSIGFHIEFTDPAIVSQNPVMFLNFIYRLTTTFKLSLRFLNSSSVLTKPR